MNNARKIAARYALKFRQTPFDSGIGSRLPEAYRKFYDEWRNTPPQPVHYIPVENKFVRNEITGEIKRTENIPLPGIVTKEMNEIFTGGEMIIQGFKRREKKYASRVPHFWAPHAYKNVIYSEILDKYMSAITTRRVIELIHKHRGLDYYILETKACDLQTLIALKLKRKLLMCLRDKTLPYDEEKNRKILEKYEKYLLSDEEIEWYGLSFSEACQKLKKIEDEKAKESIVPLKHVYRALFIEELKNPPEVKEIVEEKPASWYSKIPGLSKLKSDT